ncbi:hypothetical protein J2S43_001936 [Catenuloplanes nepalensis]|uniref:Uncharacterized protein n=1 Tax=Catenuloplanes nepalensis TaxID=587533 RepID=A0ABT9MPR4_9ACTN|nr:hypothetical protein [Catenuloplanes nepalensis]MDP9793424.1 hypothetical protein [Catenuloplanes nepalensis]
MGSALAATNETTGNRNVDEMWRKINTGLLILKGIGTAAQSNTTELTAAGASAVANGLRGLETAYQMYQTAQYDHTVHAGSAFVAAVGDVLTLVGDKINHDQLKKAGMGISIVANAINLASDTDKAQFKASVTNTYRSVTGTMNALIQGYTSVPQAPILPLHQAAGAGTTLTSSPTQLPPSHLPPSLSGSQQSVNLGSTPTTQNR